MTVIEVKEEIQKVLAKVPEEVLPEILDYLKQVQLSSLDDLKLERHLNRIINEDKELLKRLAQ